MRLALRCIAVVLFLFGVPVFLFLGACFGAFLTLDQPPDAVEKFLKLYSTFALGGLLTGAGALLWAVAKIAYPPSANR